MADDKIKEIYLFAEFTKRSGQEKIPVHIFPFEMTEKNILKAEKGHHDFWMNLKDGYKISDIEVDRNGKYFW